MSFVKDLLFGQKGTPARVEDVRAPQQSALASQLASFLSGALEQGGLPGFEGQTTAQLGDLENQLLGKLSGFLSPQSGVGQGINLGQQAINQATSGATLSPLITGITATGAAPETFQSLGDLIAGRTLTGDNPVVQGQIQAATRPIFEAFQDDLGQLSSAATQAGQFVQPGSSSPFELARSRLQTGVANAIGDTSSRIVADNFARERQNQLGLAGLLSDVFEQGQGRALQGASMQVPFQRGQLGGLMEALNIAALPRLIEQQGLDRGQQEFNRQQGTLLNIIQAALGSSAPQTVSIPGQEGSTGLLGGVLSAAGTAFGGPLGGALAGAATDALGL